MAGMFHTRPFLDNFLIKAAQRERIWPSAAPL